MENAPPSCSVSSGGAPRNRQPQTGAETEQGPDAQLQVQPPQAQEHNIFGDSNLNMVMMFLLLLHFMQYAMRPRCGC